MYKTAEANLKSQKELRQTLRNYLTPAEATLWKALKGAQINGLKFRRQYGLGPYVMDFYCPSIRLCIELDGEKIINVIIQTIIDYDEEWKRNNQIFK